MNEPDRGMPGVRWSRSALEPGVDVELSVAGRSLRAALLDVSMSGLRVLRPEGLELAAGKRLLLRFPVGGSAPLEFTAQVVRSDDGEIAFRFDAGDQADALRALIRRRGQLRDVDPE